MSLPTIYNVKNIKGKILGSMSNNVFSWFHVDRSRDKEKFDAEVGGLIVTDLAVYCSGMQKDAPKPKFTLADVDSIQSDGGKVRADEFIDCVNAFVNDQKAILEYQGASQKHIEYCTSVIEQAREVLIQLEKLKQRKENAAPVPKKPRP